MVGSQKKPTPKLAYMLARCYAGMDEHKKAADLLKPFAAKEDSKDVPLHHAIQLLLVQEHRHLKETDKARQLLDEILKGKDGKPGWGAKNIDAQKTHVQLMEDEKKYAAAAFLCDKYVKQLVRRLDDNKLKEYYFEFYYHLVYCILKHGQRMDDPKQKTKAVHDAAARIVALEKGQHGFGDGDDRRSVSTSCWRRKPNYANSTTSLKANKAARGLAVARQAAQRRSPGSNHYETNCLDFCSRRLRGCRRSGIWGQRGYRLFP